MFTGLKAQLLQENNRLMSGEKNPWVLDDLSLNVEFLRSRIKAAENKIKEIIKQSGTLKTKHELLTSIPGIGLITAST